MIRAGFSKWNSGLLCFLIGFLSCVIIASEGDGVFVA